MVWSGGCRVGASAGRRGCLEKSLVCRSVDVHAAHMHMHSPVKTLWVLVICVAVGHAVRCFVVFGPTPYGVLACEACGSI
jgi:hypothetical protein